MLLVAISGVLKGFLKKKKATVQMSIIGRLISGKQKQKRKQTKKNKNKNKNTITNSLNHLECFHLAKDIIAGSKGVTLMND